MENLKRGEKMVGWYDPQQLMRTGMEVLISSIFGKYADQRLIQVLSGGPGVIYDFTTTAIQTIDLGKPPGKGEPESALPGTPPSTSSAPRRNEVWLDFVADVGDGWNSTYAVASALASPHRLKETQGNGMHETERGEILVFGGDQVYPVASRALYQKRLVEPYTAAFSGSDRFPAVFAIPGNHDWYDNLVSFSRLFCSKEPFAGGCETPQRRSYFALKLPHGWWLLGTDVQLGSDLDGPQLDFFGEVKTHMAEGDHIILCIAEPHWVFDEVLRDPEVKATRRAIDALELLLEKRIAVFLSGDIHHYCRYESTEETDETRRKHKITAGGGGAFLHPTHGPLNVSTLQKGTFRKKTCFPSVSQSWWLCVRNFLFLWYNRTFGIVTGVAYVMILWAVMPALEEYPSLIDAQWRSVDDPAPGLNQYPFHDALYYLVLDPDLQPRHLHLRIFHTMQGVFVMALFALFTDLRSWWGRLVAGFFHGGLHFASALFVAWLSAVLVFGNLELTNPGDETGNYYDYTTYWTTLPFFAATLFAFVAGWIIGSIVMGLYLIVLLNVFRRHWNEAFSSLKIQDFKCFVRLHIDQEGTLTVFPIGLRRVPRRWQEAPAGAAGPAYRPVGDGLHVGLIEAPIVVRG